MGCKILGVGILVVDIPLKPIFKANAINFNIQLQRPNAGRNLFPDWSVAGDSFSNGIPDMSLEMRQGWVLSDHQMCKLLGSEVGVVDVPAELLFISLAVQLQVEVDGNENLF